MDDVCLQQYEPFHDIDDFEDYLTPEARAVYLQDIDFLKTLEMCDPTEVLPSKVDQIRSIFVVTEISIRSDHPGPTVAEITELAEMFNHGVARGLFKSGVFGFARWRHLKNGRSVLILHPFSEIEQSDLDEIYSLPVRS